MTGDICYSFIICKRHHNRAKMLRETFGRRVHPPNKMLLFSGYDCPFPEAVRVCQDDSYVGAIQKFISAVRYLVEKTDFNWYLMGDDDTYVFQKNLRQFIDSKDPDDLCVYAHLIERGRYPFPWPQGGSGVLMPRCALEEVNRGLKWSPRHHRHLDITLGMAVHWLRRKNSEIQMRQHNDVFNRHPNDWTPETVSIHLEHRPMLFNKFFYIDHPVKI